MLKLILSYDPALPAILQSSHLIKREVDPIYTKSIEALQNQYTPRDQTPRRGLPVVVFAVVYSIAGCGTCMHGGDHSHSGDTWSVFCSLRVV